MQTIRAPYHNIENHVDITLTIGNFDGLHLGHQELIKQVCSFKDTKPALMTFDPHPFSVIRKHQMYTLLDLDEKERLLRTFGITCFIVVDFTLDFSTLSVDKFIDFLKQIRVKRLVLGRDFRFAHQGRGTIKDLEAHFEVVILPDYLYQSTRISSTYVRHLLDSGDMPFVEALLNRPYHIHGKVIHGDKVGRTLGFPTANIEYNNYYLPKNGVYAAKVVIDGQSYMGVANIGHNPTVNYSAQKRFEVFILEFNSSLYDENIDVYFDSYLREEKKFDHVTDLLKQIDVDIKHAIDSMKNKKNVLK